jgi:hypothetical protein
MWVYIPLMLAAAILGIRTGKDDTPELQRPSVIPLWLWIFAGGSIALSGILSRL